MLFNYIECETCARKGCPYCWGCQPVKLPDGTFSRSLYTRHNETFTITSHPDTVQGDSGIGG